MKKVYDDILGVELEYDDSCDDIDYDEELDESTTALHERWRADMSFAYINADGTVTVVNDSDEDEPDEDGNNL